MDAMHSSPWLRRALAVVTLTLAGTAAQAAPVVATDYEYGPVFVSSTGTYQYTHDVGALDGYTLASASLEIWLTDDGDADRSYRCAFLIFGCGWVTGELESVDFSFDGGTSWLKGGEVDGSTCFSVVHCSSWDHFGVYDVLSALSGGSLGVTVKSTGGDFWFKKSFLTVTGTPRQVPEPATLGLLGIGLLGVGAMRRRSRRG